MPVAEVCRHLGVFHHVADLPACALLVGGQKGEHVVAVVAVQEPDKGGDPARGDDVDPFVGGDGLAEELAHAGALVVACDSQGVVRQEHGTAVSPVAWDRPGPGSAVAVADDYGLVWRGSSGWLFRQWHGTTVGAIFSVGHPLGAAVGSPGAARVCPQGRAERALVVPGGSGAGFAARPGRSLGGIFEGGPGVRGRRPRGRRDLPRAFRTADLWLVHAADCRSRYSLRTCCGTRY